MFLSIAASAGDGEMATRDIDYDDDLNPLRIPAQLDNRDDDDHHHPPYQ